MQSDPSPILPQLKSLCSHSAGKRDRKLSFCANTSFPGGGSTGHQGRVDSLRSMGPGCPLALVMSWGQMCEVVVHAACCLAWKAELLDRPFLSANGFPEKPLPLHNPVPGVLCNRYSMTPACTSHLLGSVGNTKTGVQNATNCGYHNGSFFNDVSVHPVIWTLPNRNPLR